jgi:hypothetical protein
MMISQKTTTNLNYPWQEKSVTPFVKLMAILGGLVMLGVAFSTLLTVISTFFTVVTDFEAGAFPRLFLFSFLIPLIFLGLALFGLKKIWPYVAAPTDFKLKGMTVTATKLDRPFETRFTRPFMSRSFSGSGTVTFSNEAIILSGVLPPSIGLQLGVIAVVTLVPLLLFGVGLGIIPALILAGLIGKTRETRSVAYKNIHHLTVKGAAVSLSCSDEKTTKFKFRVASVDTERLYRELYNRHPQAVMEWRDSLQQLTGAATVAG